MNLKSVTGKNWLFKKYDELYAQKIHESFNFEDIMCKFLSIRKIKINNIKNFLNPTIKNNIPNPSSIKGMDDAVRSLISMIKLKKVVGIFSDYDVDGATSAAILVKYLIQIKQPYNLFIPDRIKNGYGPTRQGFKNLIENNSKLIITADCGTSSYDAILYAKSRHVETIVIDHHQASIKLPEAIAIVNPNRIDDLSNLNYLCAAGLCFMFIVALNKKLRDINWFKKNNIVEPNILNYLDLVCLGTICDLVPITGLNRAFVKQGLKVLKKRKNLGLKNLFDKSKINTSPNTYHLSYLIGPKINAGGRVGKSSYGADLLISDDEQKANYLTNELSNFNEQRKIIELELIKKIEIEAMNIKDPIIVISGKNFHEGVIGIVASRLKEKFNKPCIVISLNKNLGKGSARSIAGFDIGSAIINAKDEKILLNGGGHKMAGGFSINGNNIELFKKYLIKKYLKSNINQDNYKNLYLDSLIMPTALNENFYKNIEILSPFDSLNPEPKFLIEDLKLIKSNIVGEKHIKAIFYSKNENIVKTIAFNSVGSLMETYLLKKNKNTLNLAGTITSNFWNGKSNIEFVINDISVNNI